MKIKVNFAALCLMLPLFILVQNSEAKTTRSPSATNQKILAAGTPPAADAEITSAEFDKAIKDADARANRTVAASDMITDQALTDQFKDLRSRFIGGPSYKNGKEGEPTQKGIKTPAELHTFLQDINNDAYYNALSPDAQFLAAQMAPLIAFHGFFNRAMDLMEPTPITHMASVVGLRTFASGVMVYFPTDQWKVGMEYITMPSSDMGTLIKDEDDLHLFMQNELIPAIAKMKDRIKALNFASKPIYFDNRFFYGTASFFSDRDQYFRIGEAERLTVLANSFYILSGLESLNAYNLQGLFGAMDQISKDFGFSTVLFNPEGTTARKRFSVLENMSKRTNLFHIRPDGDTWMRRSYQSLNQAVYNNTIAFRELKKYPDDKDSSLNFMDPRTFMSSFPRMGAGLRNMRIIVTGGNEKDPIVQSAVINSDGRHITLKNFFYNPPQTLTTLMPTAFDSTPYNPKSTILYEGKIRPWHNFLAGRPTAWNITEYKKIFPNEVNNSEDVKSTARVMAQAWGGWLLGVPMSALVL
jgi:hypothetical protein